MSILPHQLTERASNCVFCGSLLVIKDRRLRFHSLKNYGFVQCCNHCYEANGDGWSKETGKILLKILKEKNIAVPSSNSRGLLPRD